MGVRYTKTVKKPRMYATRRHVLKAIQEGSLRVHGTRVETRNLRHKNPVWKEPMWEPVHPPGRPDRPYYRVAFTTSEAYLRCTVHRLVWWAAGRHIPKGKEINHIDGDKRNCFLENLECVTSAKNTQHAVDTGLTTAPTGNASGPALTARLTCDQVRAIRCRYKQGETQQCLAHEFGTDPSQISRIVNHKAYARIESI